jgi:ketosteroid isomerase-like protein
MSVTKKPKSNGEQIRRILKKWAEATRMGKQDEVLANHSSNVLIFDVLPPLMYKGAAAYRRSWGDWQPETDGPGVFEFQNLRAEADGNVGFAHAVIRCGGKHPDGSSFEDTVRATFCLKKIKGRWMVTHQHISMPSGNGGS